MLIFASFHVLKQTYSSKFCFSRKTFHPYLLLKEDEWIIRCSNLRETEDFHLKLLDHFRQIFFPEVETDAGRETEDPEFHDWVICRKKWIGCDWLGCCDTWQDRKGLHSFLTMESRAFKIKKQPLDLLSFDELGRWSTDRIFQRSINPPIKTHNVKLIVTFKQSSQVKKLVKKLRTSIWAPKGVKLV